MKSWKRALLMPWAGRDASFDYTNKVLGTATANLIAYWPMAESSGTTALDASGNGRNGTYSNVTLGQPGIGDGRTSASFNGTTSVGNIYSASLAGAFNGQEGTVAIWARVSASGVWSDAAIRRILWIGNNTDTNIVALSKTGTANQLRWDYIANSTSKVVTSTANNPTTFFLIAMTWSLSGDALKAYYADASTPMAQIGTTQTGLGTWNGTLAAARCCIGAPNTTPSQIWSGTEAHAAVWTTPLSLAQLTTLATV